MCDRRPQRVRVSVFPPESVIMATRNLFKFVSVRPPSATEAEQECTLADRQSARVWVKAVRTHQGERKTSLADARRGVAVEFMESDNYFTRSDKWTGLRPLRKQFRALVETTCKEREHELEGEREGVTREDDAASGGDAAPAPSFSVQVRDWVLNQQEFRNAKRVLWHSYYANVFAPDVRPNDRGEIDDWIRIVDALERLDPSAEGRAWKFDESACQCIDRLRRARVHVPGEVFMEEAEAEKAPAKPTDEADHYKEKYRVRLARLTAARTAVDMVWQQKIRTLRLQEVTGATDSTDKDGNLTRADRQDSEPNADRPAQAPQAPWLFTAQDADDHPELARALEELGLALPGSLVSEVSGALDERIAADTGTLLELESRNDLFGVGAAMTIARRTQRRFSPDLDDGDDIADGRAIVSERLETSPEPLADDTLREDG